MSFSHCHALGQLAVTWLLIGCSLLCSQLGASLPVDPTLDNDNNSKVSAPAVDSDVFKVTNSGDNVGNRVIDCRDDNGAGWRL